MPDTPTNLPASLARRDIEILPPASGGPRSAGRGPERLSAAFTASAQDIPATHTKIRLYDRGQMVGSVVLVPAGRRHLVVGKQEWFPPGYLDFDEEGLRAHFAAVCERLLSEAVAVADRVDASLSSVTPGSLSPADRLSAHGFRQAGDLWLRERSTVRVVEASTEER